MKRRAAKGHDVIDPIRTGMTTLDDAKAAHEAGNPLALSFALGLCQRAGATVELPRWAYDAVTDLVAKDVFSKVEGTGRSARVARRHAQALKDYGVYDMVERLRNSGHSLEVACAKVAGSEAMRLTEDAVRKSWARVVKWTPEDALRCATPTVPFSVGIYKRLPNGDVEAVKLIQTGTFELAPPKPKR